MSNASWMTIVNASLKASANPENWKDGKINWNFVSADVWMDLHLDHPKDAERAELALGIVDELLNFPERVEWLG